MRRWMLGALLALVMVGTVQAQTSVPSGAFVKDAAGDVWLVSNGARVRVPIYPTQSEQVAAIPAGDRWLVPTADGGIAYGDAPEWAQTGPAGLSFSGANDQNTRPFDLSDGTYTARWSVKLQPRQSSCYVGAKINRADDQKLAASIMGLTVNQQVGSAASGETQLYGVKAGQYYVAASTTGCDWSVTLTPSL